MNDNHRELMGVALMVSLLITCIFVGNGRRRRK